MFCALNKAPANGLVRNGHTFLVQATWHGVMKTKVLKHTLLVHQYIQK